MEAKPFVFSQPPGFSAWPDEKRHYERRRQRERERECQTEGRERERESCEKVRDSLRGAMSKREKLENGNDHFPSRNILYLRTIQISTYAIK